MLTSGIAESETIHGRVAGIEFKVWLSHLKAAQATKGL